MYNKQEILLHNKILIQEKYIGICRNKVSMDQNMRKRKIKKVMEQEDKIPENKGNAQSLGSSQTEVVSITCSKYGSRHVNLGSS